MRTVKFLLYKGRGFWGAILFLAMIGPGCATTISAKDDASDILLGEKPDFENMASFKNLAKAEPGTERYEKARVDYLLERVAKSPYTFLRNGEEHGPARAAAHLKWKFFRYGDKAPSAELFIDNVATVSNQSGEPYLLKVSATEYYPMRIVLNNELRYLDRVMRVYREKIKEEEQRRLDSNSVLVKPEQTS